MYRLILSLISLLFPVLAQSQAQAFLSDLTNSPIQMRQKPGTEKLLTSYLSAADLKSDTVYAVLYIPSYCMRCEVVIPNFYNYMKAADPDKDIVLISAYKNPEMAKHYVKRKGYKADAYIFDADNTYERIFSFSTNGLIGTVIMKICKSRGDVIVCGDPTQVSESFAKWLATYKDAIPRHVYTSGNVSDSTDYHFPQPDAPLPTPGRHTDIRLMPDKDSPISEMAELAHYDDSLFYFIDDLNECGMVFKQDGDSLRWCDRVDFTDEEKRQFISIPDDIYTRMSASRQLFHIPIIMGMSEDRRHIEMSGSLPNLTGSDTPDGSFSIAYFNAPVIVRRSVADLSPAPLYHLNYEIVENDFAYFHFNFTTVGNSLVTMCKKKTFPMDYPVEYYRGKPLKDPFMKEFYADSNPILVAFDKTTGKEQFRFGTLDPMMERFWLGYAYTSPTVASHNGRLAYTDSYCGTIYVTDSADLRTCRETWKVFEVDTAAMPEPDTTAFYKVEYPKQYKPYFYRKIISMEMTGSHIYCIVRYGRPYDEPNNTNSSYEFVEIDRRSGRTTRLTVPKHDGAIQKSVGLRRAGDSCRPFVLLEKDGAYTVRTF